MKLTKDTLIEGVVYDKGTEYSIQEGSRDLLDGFIKEPSKGSAEMIQQRVSGGLGRRVDNGEISLKDATRAMTLLRQELIIGKDWLLRSH